MHFALWPNLTQAVGRRSGAGPPRRRDGMGRRLHRRNRGRGPEAARRRGRVHPSGRPLPGEATRERWGRM